MSMKSNVHNSVLYYQDGSGRVRIPISCILTPNHHVRIGKLYILVEGRHISVIKLLGVTDRQGIVYLRILDQQNGQEHVISSTLDPSLQDYNLWWIISNEYIMNFVEDRVMSQLKRTEELLEFDF